MGSRFDDGGHCHPARLPAPIGDRPPTVRCVAHIFQLNVSAGGVPKTPVERADIDPLGILEDDHDDKTHHGGPERALCLYSLEVIQRLQAEGHPIEPGSAGENVTISGLDWGLITPGSRLKLGDVVEVEITGYTSPCAKNAPWFANGDFSRMLQSRHPGESRLYARVLTPGTVGRGDEVRLAR